MFEAIIEIPKGSRYKYELVNGELSLDRPLNQEVPFNYGFIPRTLADDGDGLDVFVISKYSIIPNSVITFTPVGVFKCFDGGDGDDKVVGVLSGEFINDDELEQCRLQIKNYLETYKVGFDVLSFMDKNEAIMLIKETEQNLIEREFY